MSKEKQCKCCKEYWWEMNIHKQSGLCPNCYDYVADLEAKLAESQNTACKHIAELTKIATEKDKQIEELKQQLAEKEKEIEKLTNLKAKEMAKISKSFCGIGGFVKNVVDESVNIANKISFAVEQLEKVKTRIQEDFDYDDLMYWLNKQIKMLKEGK